MWKPPFLGIALFGRRGRLEAESNNGYNKVQFYHSRLDMSRRKPAVHRAFLKSKPTGPHLPALTGKSGKSLPSGARKDFFVGCENTPRFHNPHFFFIEWS